MKAANRIEYLSGQRINDLVYIKDLDLVKWKRYCLFKCSCGKEFKARLDSVKSLAIKSCGCQTSKFISESLTTHGHCTGSYTSEYTTWASMKTRCTDKSHKQYHDYGGRGISVCDRWFNSFENFLNDMGKKPNKSYSIDRIDNDGNYSPENCRWVSAKIQSRNKSSNILITHLGKTMCLTDWASELNINRITLRSRIKTLKWSAEKALTTDVQQRK